MPIAYLLIHGAILLYFLQIIPLFFPYNRRLYSLLKKVSKAKDIMYYTAWSPDGNFIAAGRKEGYIYMWQRVGNENNWQSKPIPAIANLSEHFKHLSFSPDGKYLAVFLQARVVVYDIEHNIKTRAAIGLFTNGVVAFAPDWKFMAHPSQNGGLRLVNITQEEKILESPSKQLQQYILEIRGK